MAVPKSNSLSWELVLLVYAVIFAAASWWGVSYVKSELREVRKELAHAQIDREFATLDAKGR